MSRIVEAVFVSSWDSGSLIIESRCKVNLDTKEILDIEEAPEYVSDSIDILDYERVIINGQEHPAVNEEDPDDDSYWYK